MLSKIKAAMRIDGTDHDEELNDLIETGKVLLAEAGISKEKIDQDDPLIRKAVLLYCKSAFGIDAETNEKFAWSFEEMKKLLSLLGNYKDEGSV